MLTMLTMLTIADSNDHLALFKHQNQILHPKKWCKTCVTLILIGWLITLLIAHTQSSSDRRLKAHRPLEARRGAPASPYPKRNRDGWEVSECGRSSLTL